MTLFSKTHTIRAIFIALALGLFATQAHAASACKGLDNLACAAKEQCSWVQGYERKDGRKVKAFCRTSSKGSSRSATNAGKSQSSTIAQ